MIKFMLCTFTTDKKITTVISKGYEELSTEDNLTIKKMNDYRELICIHVILKFECY